MPPPRAACADSSWTATTRSFLQLVVPAFQGSTALLSLLMSSAHVSTLCAAGSWQCEGTGVATAAGLPPENAHTTGAPLSPPVFAHELGLYRQRLRAYGRVWDLQRPVLVDKSPGPTMRALNFIHEALRQYEPGTVPGVDTLSQSYVIMWTPWCLLPMLHSASRESGGDQATAPEMELATRALYLYETLRAAHLLLQKFGTPALVVSYADLLWRTDATAQRLVRFMPCLNALDTGFAPKPGVDVVDDNHWKAHGTTQQYGASHPPDLVGYSLSERRCRREPPWATADQARRFNTSSEHLRTWSALD